MDGYKSNTDLKATNQADKNSKYSAKNPEKSGETTGKTTNQNQQPL